MEKVPGQSSEKPNERLVKLIIGFGRDIKVLESSSSVEGDLLSLDFPVFNIDLVTNQADWDAFTDSGKVLVPLGNVFVSNSGADIEHDDTALALDVVTFSEAAKFLLSSSVPDLQVDKAVANSDVTCAKVGSNGGLVPDKSLDSV